MLVSMGIPWNADTCEADSPHLWGGAAFVSGPGTQADQAAPWSLRAGV